MNKNIFPPGITAVLIILSSVNIFSKETISPKKAEEVINKIRTNFIAYSKKYRGIEFLRTETIKEYDPSDNKCSDNPSRKTGRWIPLSLLKG
jgi:hypothetical protein